MNNHLFRKCLLRTNHTLLADIQINKVQGHMAHKATLKASAMPGLSGRVKACCQVSQTGGREWHLRGTPVHGSPSSTSSKASEKNCFHERDTGTRNGSLLCSDSKPCTSPSHRYSHTPDRCDSSPAQPHLSEAQTFSPQAT